MLRIEPLGTQYDRELFDCGQPDLENYLKRLARQHADKGVSRTYEWMRDQTKPSPVYREQENASAHHTRHRSAHAATTRKPEYLGPQPGSGESS